MARSSFWLRALNLESLDTTATKRRSAPEPEEPPANPWLRSAPAAEPAARPELPWHAERVEAPRWYWRVLRVILIVALAIVVLVGLRTMFFPQTAPVPKTKSDPAAMFPAAAASGVADRFATNFLTWDQADPSERSAALSEDVAGLGDGDKFGWDGTGKQTAGSAYTVAVDATSASDATVTVAVQVTPYDKDGKSLAATWQGLAVPMHIQGARPVVAAGPALVALPQPHQVDGGQAPAEDTALSNQTESYAKSFFKAYGSSSDVSAVSAPTAHFAGLGGSVTFQTLTSWTVYAGSGDSRQARAVVAWKTDNGAALTSTYTVTLTRVTAGSTTRWQAAAITAAKY